MKREISDNAHIVLRFWFNPNRLLFRQIFGSLNYMNSLNLQIETVLQIYF